MNITLKELRNVKSESCITIVLNTHRTSPDNKQDAITLKNLIKEVEGRLIEDESKRDAKNLLSRLQEVEASIDHEQNQESLILFVNEDIAEYTRLPIEVVDRVIIDHTFATRDLVRALNQENHYYVLVLSQEKARLIEAFNDKVVKEMGQPFPIKNNHLYSTNQAEASVGSKHTHLLAEYFNRIDKEVNLTRKENTLPVVLCTEESNYHEYIKIADQKNSILSAYLNKSSADEKAQHLVKDAWNIVEEYTVANNNARKDELAIAVGNGNFLSDVNEIWRGIQEGRIQTLFIEQGLFQPGIMEMNNITIVSEDERNLKNVVDDIYDELIEANANFGGDVVFLPIGELKDFNGFGAITRY